MSEPTPSIFVSVASFCDPLLLHTLQSGVTKAQDPERLTWGVVDQHPEDRGGLLRSLVGSSGLRYVHIHPAQSRGVCWARSIVNTLYTGEAYVLQIDSHMLFEQGLDLELIEQIKTLSLRSAKPILTMYPYGFSFDNDQPVVTERIDPKAALTFEVAPDSSMSPERVTLSFVAKPVSATEPLEGFHVAGGFLFAPGEFVQEIPYDPRLYFHGEEQSLALRAYTHGWDIFHPIRIPLYHHYKPAGQAHDTQHWQPQWEAQRDFNYLELTQAAQQRLVDLVDESQELGVYGVGQTRTLKSFASASGIDYARRTLSPPLGREESSSTQHEEIVFVVELNHYHPRPYVFTDFARTLVEGLRASGRRAQHVVNALPFKGTLLMLGWTPEWLAANAEHVNPSRAILFNAEQLGSSSPVATQEYLQAMRGWVVADIHEANIQFLKEALGDEVSALELPVAPHPILGFTALPLSEPMVDVIFFGSPNERREKVLNAMRTAGLSVRHVNGAYGLELTRWLQRARLMVHVHYYDTRLFPALRMLRPVMMGLPVVCESSVFSAINDWSASGMLFTEAKDMVETCKALLADPDRQRAMALDCRNHAPPIDIGQAWKQLEGML